MNPFILQSDSFAATGLAGKTLVPVEQTFRNVTSAWLRVHRLGWNYGWDSPTVGAARPEWKIKWGSTQVTKDFVPVAATVWRCNNDEVSPFVEFTKPVYLAPNDKIDVQVKYNTNASGTYALYAVCSMIERPDAIRIPFLAGWEGAARTTNGGAFSEEVPLNALANDFAEAVEVERIIGRVGLRGGAVTPSLTAWPRAYAATRQITADLEFHDGSRVTRVPTPFAALFDLARQSWLANFKLPSKGYIRAVVAGTLTDSDFDAPIYPYLGMLGYRTIG